MSFRNNLLNKLALPPGTVWFLSEIAEAKGKQDLCTKQTPQLLEALREAALIYAVLRESSSDWHEGRHDPVPWLNYFLSIIRRAYREFEERAASFKSPRGAKTALIQAAIENFEGEFTLAELKRSCPGVSHDMLRRVLKDLQKTGIVQSLGRGPGAKWRKKRQEQRHLDIERLRCASRRIPGVNRRTLR